jgi:hypothetical protein
MQSKTCDTCRYLKHSADGSLRFSTCQMMGWNLPWNTKGDAWTIPVPHNCIHGPYLERPPEEPNEFLSAATRERIRNLEAEVEKLNKELSNVLLCVARARASLDASERMIK